MKSKILGLLAVGLLAGPMGANAAVLYELTWNGTTLSYTSPTFVAADVVTCDFSGSVNCFGINLYPTQESGVDRIGWATRTLGSGGSESFHGFADGAFGSFGAYNEIQFSRGSLLTVSRIPDTVPEPGTLALLGLGLAGLGLSRRRKGV